MEPFPTRVENQMTNAARVVAVLFVVSLGIVGLWRLFGPAISEAAEVINAL